MTRDEHRKACIEAIQATEISYRGNRIRMSMKEAEDAFDALNGIARVLPPEATEEMIDSTFTEVSQDEYKQILPVIRQMRLNMFRAMSAAGDLTNPPKEKS